MPRESVNTVCYNKVMILYEIYQAGEHLKFSNRWSCIDYLEFTKELVLTCSSVQPAQ